MYGSLDISVSGMIAQRIRMECAAANIANQFATEDSSGKVNPYRARQAMLSPGDPTASTPEGRAMGVHVASIDINQGPPKYQWDPTNKNALKDGPKAGYVPVPDISPVLETMNAMEAERAYGANVVMAEASKAMVAQALRLIA